MYHPTRRHFLGASLAASGVVGLSSSSLLATSANQQVNLGLIGCGGRGSNLLAHFKGLPCVRMAGFCDPDRERADTLAKDYPDAKTTADLRELLDDSNIDAVVIATCNHWHCLAAIWAMQAGKHVYVEKPLGHYQWEGAQTVKAAKKYGKICQVGTQQRSDPMQAEIKQFLHEDKSLGALRWVRVNRFGVRSAIGKRMEPLQIPKAVDYNLWVGPAAKLPIMRNRLQYDWHWDWNTGSGEMGNWGVHVFDDVRNNIFLDQVAIPSRIAAGGGRYAWQDAGNSPNVMFAIAQAGEIPVVTCLTNLPSKPNAKSPPDRPGPGTGYIAYCEGGRYEGRRGKGKAFDADGNLIKEFKGNSGNGLHQQNFVDAIRSDDSSKLAAPVQVGHDSTEWCNQANVAYRVGLKASTVTNGNSLSELFGDICKGEELLSELRSHLSYHAPAAQLSVGPLLEFDVKQGAFTDNYAEQANSLLRRKDRQGFEVPEIV